MKKILTIILAVLFMASFSHAELNMSPWKGDSKGTIGEIGKRWNTIYVNTIDASTITSRFDRSMSFSILDLSDHNGYPHGRWVTQNTSPTMTVLDTLPALVWNHVVDPATPAVLNFRLPSNYSGGLGFRLLTSRSTASPFSVRWGVTVNSDDTAFETASIQQASVIQTEINAAASNEVLELVCDTAALTSAEAGKWVRLEFAPGLWPEEYPATHTGTAGTFELKGLEYYYTGK